MLVNANALMLHISLIKKYLKKNGSSVRRLVFAFSTI